jgi:photosystem II stability/assembly factor-like uncharacterized protein
VPRIAVRWLSIAACLVAATLLISGQRQPAGRPARSAEAPDAALRRAQAMHDMYAAPPDKQQLSTRVERFRAASAAAAARRPARPLPIVYSTFDPDFRLKPLVRESQQRPGAIFSRAARGVAGAPPAPAAWTNIGPTNLAGRVSALAVHPTNAQTIYRGTAGGGVWKTTDGGTTWTPLTDSLGNLSIGAIAIARSKPDTVYVGTGEGALGIDGIDGIGLIASTDGGNTWSLPVNVPGRRFFDLNVHPTVAEEVVAATLNGIQKSIDGGKNWRTTLSGFSATQVVRVPQQPTHLVAAVWDIAKPDSSGNGFVYRSMDGGDTWTRVDHQPLDFDAGRISLATAADASVLYAMVASASGDVKDCPNDRVDQIGIYRSTDAGATWTLRADPITGTCPQTQFDPGFDSILGGQGWYANALAVDPSHPTTVYAGGLDVWKSTDGAGHWTKLSHWDIDPANPHFVHADIHALVFAGTSLLVGDDGGMHVTANGGTAFSGRNTGIPTRQYYSVSMTPADATMVIGGAQDNGTNIRIGTGTTFREVIGGDGFATAANPNDAKNLYGTVYAARIFRTTNGGNGTNGFPEVTATYGDKEKLPFISTLMMDPKNPSTLYTATNFLYRSTDGGSTWRRTSDDDLGDGDDPGYVSAIAVSPSDSQKLMTGSASGKVKKSTDGGAHWTAVSGVPRAYVSHLEFDPSNANTFYVSLMSAGPNPRLIKFANGAQSPTRIDNGLPGFPVHVVRVDPANSNALYAGLDVGLYTSTDGGTSWKVAGNGLPAVSIWDIAIGANGSMMRVASHGRGFWEFLKAPGAPRSTSP